jgi:hypothetical protein
MKYKNEWNKNNENWNNNQIVNNYVLININTLLVPSQLSKKNHVKLK